MPPSALSVSSRVLVYVRIGHTAWSFVWLALPIFFWGCTHVTFAEVYRTLGISPWTCRAQLRKVRQYGYPSPYTVLGGME